MNGYKAYNGKHGRDIHEGVHSFLDAWRFKKRHLFC